MQQCDFVSFFAYLRLMKILEVGGWNNRLQWLTDANVEEIFAVLRPVINEKANGGSAECGFVVYPK